jgi:hypothetical protein
MNMGGSRCGEKPGHSLASLLSPASAGFILDASTTLGLTPHALCSRLLRRLNPGFSGKACLSVLSSKLEPMNGTKAADTIDCSRLFFIDDRQEFGLIS